MSSHPGAHLRRLANGTQEVEQQRVRERAGKMRARHQAARVARHLCDTPASSSSNRLMRATMSQAENRFFPLIASAPEDAKEVRRQHRQELDHGQVTSSSSSSRRVTRAGNQMTPEPDLNETTAERMREATSRLPSGMFLCSEQMTMSTASTTTRSRRRRLSNPVAWLLLASLALCNHHLKQVSCQTGPADAFLGPAESRAETALGPSNLLHKQPSGQNLALDQLVQFLSSINNQQQQQQQANAKPQQQQQPQQRRAVQPQPLPLGTMGNQRVGLPQPVSSSTPVNPFIGLQFQPTRRQQFPAPQQQPNSLNNFVPSSSPSTPLTLNRLSNQFSTNAMQHNQRFNGQPAPAPLQPLNTVPLGAFSNQRPSYASPQRVNNNNNQQQQQPRPNQFQLQPNLRSPLMPPPSQQMNGQQPARPIISGFAPSGPPPSSATNNAISVVQSPANAIGQQTAQSSSAATEASSSTTSTTLGASTSESQTRPTQPAQTTTTTSQASGSTSTTTTAAPTTTTSTSTTASTAGSEQQSSEQQTTTTGTLIASSSSSSSSSDSSSQGSSGGAASEMSGAETTLASAMNTWNPVNNRTAGNRQQATSLAPSPDIVTVPPGYDPNAPPPAQSYDIAVSAQMGPSGAKRASNSVLDGMQASALATPVLSIVPQPTETTTIIWSSESSSSSAVTAPTRMSGSTSASAIAPTKTQQESSAASGQQQTQTTTLPSRIRDTNSMQNDEPDPSSVVYGKRQPALAEQPAGRGFIQTAPLDTQVRPFSAGTLKSNHAAAAGASSAPFKPSRPLNGNQMGGGSGVSVAGGFTIVASGNQSMPSGDIQDYIAGAPPPIVSASSAGQPPNSAEPTISAHGGPAPTGFDLAPEASSGSRQEAPAAAPAAAAATTSTQAPRLRRPTFKPKPAVPPIRIDSCIVGDDTSCDQSHNERCVTEYGISSCHCKPGFARLSQLRGYCSPISLLQFNLKIERLADDRRLAFNQTLENPNSEEYQYLEFETIQALASAIQQTALAKQFMGARLNRFHERKGKVWANVSINLEASNVTRSERVQQLAGQELAKLVQARRGQTLGESTLVMDGAKESISKLTDVNECASRELNDCSKHATCTNDFGGYSCQCLPGYEDKLLAQAAQTGSTSALTGSGGGGETNSSPATATATADGSRSKMGRVCMGCSASFCSNRGECSIVEGKKQCKCRPNFMGARCDIDSEILFVAVGGSLVGLLILLVTFWCLFVFNRRWRREQQKMDAMSATSGLTYNYVNGGSSSANSSNSLMSAPRASAAAGPIAPGPLGRSSAAAYLAAGHQRRHSHFGGGATAADQQAIMGSSSSGSSAASQPIACNPYAAQYPYEDAGLLIAPASTGSSEQTSPGASSYRGAASNYLAAGNAYTLSGHHHHHHHLVQQQQQQLLHHPQLHQHHHHGGAKQPLTSQFHPALDYARTLNSSAYQQHHHMTNGYDTRWRTLQQQQHQAHHHQQQQQQHDSKQQLAAYYLVR